MPRTQNPKTPTKPKISSSPTSKTPAQNWRIKIKQNQLISQTSTILLQRHTKFWAPLLKPLNLSTHLTPLIFLQILTKLQTHPKTLFNFFTFAQKALHFKPDLKSQCHVTRILLGSHMSQSCKPILDSIIQDNPPSKILPLLIQSKENAGFRVFTPVLDSVFECYCCKDRYLEGLEVYLMGRKCGLGLSLDNCNVLLSLMCEKNEVKLGWCCYCSIVRNVGFGDRGTWNVVARMLCKDGKFERVGRILDIGIYTCEIFDMVIDGYSKRGDFEGAFGVLNEMSSKGFELSFSTYSSILDGACKCKDSEVIENVMCCMVEKGCLLEAVVKDYDLIIRRLCDLGKTFAVDLFFERANGEKIGLEHDTYRSMFKALVSEEGRVEDAIEMYNIMREKNVLVNESCYDEFVNVLCKEDPSHEVSELLVEIVREGFGSEAKGLSEYISKQCAKGRCRDAEELLNEVLDQGCLLHPCCCGYFVKWYCSSRRIGKAIALHGKLEGLKGVLNIDTYNILLGSLLRERRIGDTIKVFEYMKACDVLNSESFTLVIRGLCHEKDLRNAMRLHDEMLELGLKPDLRTYKRLISGFR